MKRPVYRGGKVHVNQDRCATCIFRPEGLRLAPGRLPDFVEDHLRQHTVIVCHELYESPTPAACRGFYDLDRSDVLRVAQRLGVLKFQPVEKS